MNHSLWKRALALTLSLTILFSLLSGCAGPEQTPSPAPEQESGQAPEKPETRPPAPQQGEGAASEPLQNETMHAPLVLSADWEDYAGDLETFVYGLLTHQLEYQYEVFPAYTELSDGSVVSGLAYSDFPEGYVNEDETMAYFPAGLLPFCGETPIPEEEFQRGLILHRAEQTAGGCGYLLKYRSEAFAEHCVVFDQYVQYGVDESGRIFYTAEAYRRGNCDETLGSLYSYDENRFVLDLDVGSYTPVKGVSLASRIDYAQLEAEIFRLLEAQDQNHLETDLVSNLYVAQDVVASWLASQQEETFLGHDTAELAAMARELDPGQCLRETPEGILVLDIGDMPEDDPEALLLWLFAGAGIITTAVLMAAASAYLGCPELALAAEKLVREAVKVFLRMVVSGEVNEEGSVKKASLTIAVKTLTGFTGDVLLDAVGGAGDFLTDTTLEALLKGVEHAAGAWIDGENGKSMIESFGYGTTLGFVMNACVEGAEELFSLFGEDDGGMAEYVAKEISPKLTAFLCERYAEASDVILTKTGELLTWLQAKAGESDLLRRFLAEDASMTQLETLAEEPETDGDRADDYENAAGALQQQWLQEDASMPPSIRAAVEAETGAAGTAASLKALSPARLAVLITEIQNGYVLYENPGKEAAALVPASLYRTAQQGRADETQLTKLVKAHMGAEYFERLLPAA